MPRIVLAEDDSTMARLLTMLLRMDGYEVITVDGEGDLVETINRLRPDALILDMVLAGRSGLDLLTDIRSRPFGGNLYVLMISGLSVGEECLRSGADDFLLKPFMPEELTGLLRLHLPSPS